jgi:hypothetical protein
LYVEILGVTYGFPSLCIILTAVACVKFEKLKAGILDVRQKYITPQHVKEDEHDHTNANCFYQATLSECIRYHQETMAQIHKNLPNILV